MYATTVYHSRNDYLSPAVPDNVELLYSVQRCPLSKSSSLGLHYHVYLSLSPTSIRLIGSMLLQHYKMFEKKNVAKTRNYSAVWEHLSDQMSGPMFW